MLKIAEISSYNLENREFPFYHPSNDGNVTGP